MDVEASRSIRQAEIGAARTMINRTEGRFGLKPKRLAADSAYGSAPTTLDWLVNDKKIEPHIPVIDMERRKDGILSREDFRYDKARDVYICPAGKLLTTTGRIRYDDMRPYSASKRDCEICPLKVRCCPNDTSQVLPNVYEEARDVARAIARSEAFGQSCRDRKRIEMLFAHLMRILRLGQLTARPPPAVEACLA
jgi:DDE family transposase